MLGGLKRMKGHDSPCRLMIALPCRIVHPTDIPIFYEAMGPIMVGHGTARQTDVIVKVGG